MKINKLVKNISLAAGTLLLWEVGTNLWEQQKSKDASDYWHTYYPQDVINRSNQIRQTHTIQSTGIDLHIDLYPQTESKAPIVIFNHGAAGYCRIFVELALALYDLGYTVVLPDQRGQGLSGGRQGDYTIAECTQNILDVSNWAKSRFAGSLFMIGGSVGGGLTYYAAAAGAPVDAIASLNLFDFGNNLDGILISRLAPLAKSETVVKVITTLMKLLMPFYWLRIPFNWIGAFDKLMDARDADFQTLWDADPVPSRLVSIRSLLSNLITPPAILFEHNQIPTLVINQAQDLMVDPIVTRQNFERLGGSKQYLEIPFGHWLNQPEFWETIVTASHNWFQECLENKKDNNS